MSSRSVILWAEDDDNDVFLMELALKRAAVSMPFVRVADGVEATEYLEGKGRYSDRDHFPVPCLLLLDIKMPRMTGLDVLEWKRSKPELNELTVVVLSSSNQEQDRDKASRLGAKEYLVKPASIEGLIRQVKKLHDDFLRAA